MRGISMYDSSSVSTLFSSLGSSKSTGSGLFGINLSEYASIRSGSYGKLMRSYFSMDSTKSTSKSDDSTKNTIEDLATTTSTSKDSTKTLAHSKGKFAGFLIAGISKPNQRKDFLNLCISATVD